VEQDGARRERLEAYALTVAANRGGPPSLETCAWLRREFALGELSAGEIALVEGLIAGKNRGRREKIARAEFVEAYGIARAAWIRRFGLPAHEEDAVLRACYSIGDTTAGEWAMIEYLRPREGKPRGILKCLC
jgi:hypothetical protein